MEKCRRPARFIVSSGWLVYGNPYLDENSSGTQSPRGEAHETANVARTCLDGRGECGPGRRLAVGVRRRGGRAPRQGAAPRRQKAASAPAPSWTESSGSDHRRPETEQGTE